MNGKLKPPQKAFRLLQDLPHLQTGTIFILKKKKLPWKLVNAWDNGNCQLIHGGGVKYAWCGKAFQLPFQVADDPTWFEEIDNSSGRYHA